MTVVEKTYQDLQQREGDLKGLREQATGAAVEDEESAEPPTRSTGTRTATR